MNQNHSVKHGITLVIFVALIMSIAAPAFIPSQEIRAMPAVQEVGAESTALFINYESSRWSKEEMSMVRETLDNTIDALDEAGLNGQTLLSGYRFRRYHGLFVDEIDGRIALVRHGAKEIILADTAFMRLWGYYIYHELGHVVDKRLDRELSSQFYELAKRKTAGSSNVTPDGFWLNEHARNDREEATADAFALWIVMRYTENPRPVFWNTPNNIDFDEIVQTLEETMRKIS